MQHQFDVRGLATAAPDAAALASFETALQSLYRFQGDPLDAIRETLSRWPEFALAHIFRAMVLLGFTERRFARGAAASLDQAEALLADVPERERQLYHAARRMLAADWDAACQLLESLLLDNPLDMLALHTAHNLDFFRGDVWSLRNRINRVLPCWTADTPGYPHVLGMQAFGLEECNHYPEAEQVARDSLTLMPANPWAVHALAHVFEMQGRIDEGIEHLESRVSDWSVGSGFAYHNWWHLALFYLDRGDSHRVIELYDEQLGTPPARFALNMIDAVALLWRLHLLEIDIGSRAEPVAAWWREQIDSGGAYYAFNDLHAALALALVSDREGLLTLRRRLEEATPDDGNIALTQQLGLPLVGAIDAHAAGRFTDCARMLAELRDQAQSSGGSHAQRDLLTLTLIDAAARGGRKDLAGRYLNERLVMKPASPMGSRLQERYGLNQ